MDFDLTFCVNHLTLYKCIKSLCFTPKQMHVYVNYISIKLEEKTNTMVIITMYDLFF